MFTDGSQMGAVFVPRENQDVRLLLRRLHDSGETRLPLLFGGLFHTRRDGPYVPRRIHDPPDPVTPELILHREHHFGSGVGCTLHGLIHVFNINIEHHWRAAVRSGRMTWPPW